ncbi:hypothetical protein MXB_5406 [Myxobolus squamalis]|nr:hypothetical protein MXB_5406 [Myxobolus squamalis]
MSIAKLYPISTIYCSIHLNDQRLLLKAIRIQVRTTPTAPILKSISSIPRGFIINWFPPSGMHQILSTSINCQEISDYNIWKNIVQNDTTTHRVENLHIGDNLKCNIVSRDQFGDSLPLGFNHKVEDVKYEIILHSIDAKLFKFTFRAFENDRSDAKNTFLAHDVIDLEIKVDNRKSIYLEKISPNMMLSKSYPHNGNKFVLSLKDLFARSKIIGTLTVFKYELKEHREGNDINIVEIADRYAKIRFVPFFGEMYDFSIINVYFLTRIDEAQFKDPDLEIGNDDSDTDYCVSDDNQEKNEAPNSPFSKQMLESSTTAKRLLSRN